jgi:hypothetical protein
MLDRACVVVKARRLEALRQVDWPELRFELEE